MAIGHVVVGRSEQADIQEPSHRIESGASIGPRRSGIPEVEHLDGPGLMPILPLALRATAAHVPVHKAPSVPDEFIARTQPDNVRRDLHRLVQLKGMQRLLYPRLVVEQHVTIDQRHILHIRDCDHADVLQVFFAPTNRVGPQPDPAYSLSSR
jgi:hypothetical protein